MSESPEVVVIDVSELGSIPPRPRRGVVRVVHDANVVKVRGEGLNKVWWQGRQWAVTSYGLEKRDGTYPIKAGRFHENLDGNYSWPQHMSEKIWVDTEDFITAWLVAIALHSSDGTKLRRAIGDTQVRAGCDV